MADRTEIGKVTGVQEVTKNGEDYYQIAYDRETWGSGILGMFNTVVTSCTVRVSKDRVNKSNKNVFVKTSTGRDIKVTIGLGGVRKMTLSGVTIVERLPAPGMVGKTMT